MKLAFKVVLASILGTLAVVVAFGWVRVQREIELFDSDMRKDHRLIGATLGVAVASTWSSLGPDQVLELIRRADEQRPSLRIEWLSRDGSASGRLPIFEQPRLATLGAVDHAVLNDPAAPDRQYLVTRVPVREGVRLLGVIEIAESLDSRDVYVRNSIVNSIIATLAMIVISGVCVSVVGVWLVGRPLRELSLKAKRVGQGDLEGPLSLDQNDEVGELAREVNAMCERLAQAKKQMHEETLARIETLEQLRHADRLITVGRLAAGVAHELGTPLNVIVGRVKMIRRTVPEGTTHAEYLSVVAEQAERIATIIRQLMDFARPREPKIAAVNLGRVSRSIVKLLEPMAKKRDVSLSVTSDASVLAMGDPMQLEQVASNLVVNAIQACNEGGHVTISYGFEPVPDGVSRRAPGGERAYLRVSDDGQGMDAATKGRIFEPFFTTKDIGQGTGLGLSVVHGIIEEHGGFISVTSEPGSGSTFSVFLQVAA